MSTVVAETKAGKVAKNPATGPVADSRAARFRSKTFTREVTAAFHAAKLRALDTGKAKT